MAIQTTDHGPAQDERRGKAVGVTAVLATAGAVGACALCCTLPVAFPAVALGLLGGGVAVLGLANRIMILAGLVAVVSAWAWLWMQSRRTGKRPARLTLRLMAVATLLLVLALAWPLVERPLLALLL
ncbi:MAG: hypothetical protein EPO51_11945 [Phenylobacterium sp.]|uniref:MFS transporter permease n=1 Tax=Phenylobacterium sp. TaxID=1871053 RepID=UPI0011FFD3B8|nr:MFS transporter permease [Phenylobacterium sp.]TAJ71827.1 MAG: hypothetical protein EPO51_11945 [Phenylobacterium sp.]